jgi:DNA-binding MarR family transcriptional regulator
MASGCSFLVNYIYLWVSIVHGIYSAVKVKVSGVKVADPIISQEYLRTAGNPAERSVGGLLRLPAQACHRRIVSGLHRAGFRDLRLPHIAVLLYPGPDGCRPSELAERAGISKQAMNQLLQSMERLGYLRRGDAEEGGRARIVHFTERGQALWAKELEIVAEIDQQWRAELGDERYDRLRSLLGDVWMSSLVQA